MKSNKKNKVKFQGHSAERIPPQRPNSFPLIIGLDKMLGTELRGMTRPSANRKIVLPGMTWNVNRNCNLPERNVIRFTITT